MLKCYTRVHAFCPSLTLGLRHLILSHEIGHHQKFHTMPSVFGSLSDLHSESNEQLRSLEIEADEFAGFILQKLGASLYLNYLCIPNSAIYLF